MGRAAVNDQYLQIFSIHLFSAMPVRLREQKRSRGVTITFHAI
jgi:hypothetical protein